MDKKVEILGLHIPYYINVINNYDIPLPIKIHVCECLNYFNSRRCNETMVVQENMLLHSLIGHIHVASL
ncbi:MAG: hypothetical protein ACJAZQ_002696 [Cognaticolwellia sp.]|jgi:hypothetical protein